MVTRLGLSWVFAVYRSGRGVSLPSVSTDMSRRWSGPNECSTNSMPFEGAQASDLAVPLFPSTGFTVGLQSTSVSPSSFTRKLETELSPPLVVKYGDAQLVDDKYRAIHPHSLTAGNVALPSSAFPPAQIFSFIVFTSSA